jgi:hypothetical protein
MNGKLNFSNVTFYLKFENVYILPESTEFYLTWRESYENMYKQSYNPVISHFRELFRDRVSKILNLQSKYKNTSDYIFYANMLKLEP